MHCCIRILIFIGHSHVTSACLQVRKTDVWVKSPRIFVVGLNRFSFTETGATEKIGTSVDFPVTGLRVRAQLNDRDGYFVFNLKSCVLHKGAGARIGHIMTIYVEGEQVTSCHCKN